MCRENEEVGREDSFTFCFQERLNFHACQQGSGCEEQRVSTGAIGLVHTAVPGLTSARVELIFS